MGLDVEHATRNMHFKHVYRTYWYNLITTCADLFVVIIPFLKIDAKDTDKDTNNYYLLTEILCFYVFIEFFFILTNMPNE